MMPLLGYDYVQKAPPPATKKGDIVRGLKIWGFGATVFSVVMAIVGFIFYVNGW